MAVVSSRFAHVVVVGAFAIGALGAATQSVADTFPKHVLVQASLGPDSRDTGGGRERTPDLLVRLVTPDGSFTYYAELHCDVPTLGRDGRIEVALGTVEPSTNPLDLDFREAYWLSIVECPDESACTNGEPRFCDGPELLREPLAAVGYAYRSLHADETDRARYADDCDRLDGHHSSDFMPAGTDLWVDSSGDTMSGPLTLSGDPALPLEAATKQYVDRPRPDLTVPSGYSILGDTGIAPTGYRYTGQQVLDNNAWTTRADMPDVVTAGHAVECGGVLWVASDERLLSHDQATDTWAVRAWLPRTNYPLDFGMASVGGRIYLIGGHENRGLAVDWNNEYDPATDRWSSRAPLPSARRQPLAVGVGGRIHAIGGVDDAGRFLHSHDEYDPSTDSWQPRSYIDLVGSAATVLDGKIYVVGTSTDGFNPPHDALRVYDVASGSWSSGPRLPIDTFTPAVAAMDGHVYVIHSPRGESGLMGGGWWGSRSGADVFVLDLASGQWRPGTPEPASHHASTAVSVGGAIHVVGGQRYDTRSGITGSYVHAEFTAPGTLFVHRKN